MAELTKHAKTLLKSQINTKLSKMNTKLPQINTAKGVLFRTRKALRERISPPSQPSPPPPRPWSESPPKTNHLFLVCGHFLKITSKCIYNLFSYVSTDVQTNTQTNSDKRITSLAEVITAGIKNIQPPCCVVTYFYMFISWAYSVNITTHFL